MATEPCQLHRLEGTELTKKARIIRGPDASDIIASYASSLSKAPNEYRVRFELEDMENWGDHPNYGDVVVLAAPSCGPGRVHILGRTTAFNQVIIENYSYVHGKGDLYLFEEIRSYSIGTIYLFDIDRVFPPDSCSSGTIIKATFNADVPLGELDARLRARGYRLAILPSNKPSVDMRGESFPSDIQQRYYPIWGRLDETSLDGVQRVYVQDLMDVYRYHPVWEIVPAGTNIMAEKI